MKYILPLLLFCVPAQAEVVREVGSLLYPDNVNTRVGINTLTPTATLDVNGTVSMLGPVAVTGSAFSVGTSTFVVTGGKVGVGRSPITFPLEAAGIIGSYRAGSDVQYVFMTGGDAGSYTIGGSGSAKPLNITNTDTSGNNTANHLIFTNSAERMRITGAGNIGIGTTSPASKVDISSGTIRMAGTGAPTVGFALCLAASGAMGTCSDTPAANGACTCVAP